MAKIFRISFIDKYQTIAMESYLKAWELKKKVIEIEEFLRNDSGAWLAAKDAKSDLIEYSIKLDNSCIQTIIFSALAVEAFIYDYGARKTSDSFVQNYLDKLDLVSKWVVVPQMVTGKDFPRDRSGFKLLRELVRNRNSLIHHKSLKIDLETENYIDQINKMTGDLLEKAERAVATLDKLTNDLKSIDPEVESLL